MLCVGVTYKADVADLRESSALKVLEELRWQGADVRYWDPHFPTITVAGEAFESSDLNDELVDWADAVVLLVAHNGPDYRWLAERASLVLDTINRLRELGSPNVVPL